MMTCANGMPDSLDSVEAYDAYIEHMRGEQYPMLKDAIYLDHAGMTPYSKLLMDRFQTEMMSNLFGNPHSASPSSQRSTSTIEDARLEMLRFFNADPEHFDLVFTANATAALKLIVEAFREQPDGFWFGYHADSHTSLVGMREAAKSLHCFGLDEEVDLWINGFDRGDHGMPQLFAYPAQSNLNGRRLPRDWCKRIQQNSVHQKTYTLLDAAAYASTSPLDFSDEESAPDFTVLSLYKIFGFPDLGALIVRRSSGHVFDKRKYFGGGTVDMVVSIKEQWHARKSGCLHDRLEDGTLPVHSIVALKLALKTYRELFGMPERVLEHTASLTAQLYQGLESLNHGNGRPVCTIYKHAESIYGDSKTQGPIIAFNVQDSKGNWVSNTELEKLASIKSIHLRTGGLCNPGGISQSLGLAPWEMRENFSSGHRCGNENDIMNGKPTGVIRVSLGATSTKSDVIRFVDFMREFFVDSATMASKAPSPMPFYDSQAWRFHVESLTVYPIKSCTGWQIPEGSFWEIRKEGLAWDREWCVVHLGTGKALSQKQHPRMALIRPTLDFKAGVLRINAPGTAEQITAPLSKDPSPFDSMEFAQRNASVCGDRITARLYTSSTIEEFLSRAVGVPCTLARFPATTTFSASARHSKTHLQQGQTPRIARPILLSNESPILTISRASLNRLNEEIKAKGGKAAHPSVFRANIVLAESPLLRPGQERPWAEDHWRSMRVGGEDGPVLEFLGGCRRCQMVCIDQVSGEKNPEPFVTLAKTRRFDGRVLFGVHTALASADAGSMHCNIKAGDMVETFT